MDSRILTFSVGDGGGFGVCFSRSVVMILIGSRVEVVGNVLVVVLCVLNLVVVDVVVGR